jgi:acetylglutamate kinase
MNTSTELNSVKPLVIKIGGAIIEKSEAFDSLLSVIASLQNQPIVLVHGGGCLVDQMLNQAGYISEKKQGLRITPASHMPLIAGVLAGSVNKTIVAKAARLQLPAVGLSLCDGEMVRCQLSDEGLGMVGVPVAQESKLLDTLLKNQFLPVISSIGSLSNGELVNVNADDAAVAICQLLNANLLLLTDVNGVKGKDGHYISSLDSGHAAQLIEQGIIAGGMTAKVNAALSAANKLRRSIAVASWQSPQQIINLLNGENIGTRIQPNAC